MPSIKNMTMTGQMDGQVNDETDGWNDASRRPLLYVMPKELAEFIFLYLWRVHCQAESVLH
jgi:hypothetical protein